MKCAATYNVNGYRMDDGCEGAQWHMSGSHRCPADFNSNCSHHVFVPEVSSHKVGDKVLNIFGEVVKCSASFECGSKSTLKPSCKPSVADPTCLHHTKEQAPYSESTNNTTSNPDKGTTMNLNSAFTTLYNALEDLQDSIGDIKQQVSDLELTIPKSTTAAPATVIVQGSLRGNNVLHVQRGNVGNYQSVDTTITDAEADSIRTAPKDGSSFAQSGKGYVIGKEYPDGSIRIACVTRPNPFGAGVGSSPQSSTRSPRS